MLEYHLNESIDVSSRKMSFIERSVKWIVSHFLNQLNNFWSPEDYYCFVNTFKYDEEKVTLDKYTILEDSQKRIIYDWLQYFSPDTLRKEFEENGFSIKEVYSDVAGMQYNPESTEFAIVAEKIK